MKNIVLPGPAYEITVTTDAGGAQDITQAIWDRLISLTLTDKRGFESDQFDLSLHDPDGGLALPRLGAVIKLKIGFQGQPLVHKGSFTVDEVEHSGSRDKITIRARGVDFGQGFKKRKERSWHDTTIGDLARTIAGEHGLTPMIADKIAAIILPHTDQTNESDSHLLTRLAKLHDAVATVKNGNLLLMPLGAAKTVSGQSLPTHNIRRTDGDKHRYRQAEAKVKYTGVKAFWDDKQAAKKQAVVVGDEKRMKVLRAPFPDAAQARAATTSEWQKLQRGLQSMSLTLATGRPDLILESPVNLTGWKTEINNTDWITAEVTHMINDNGFTSRVMLEVRESG